MFAENHKVKDANSDTCRSLEKQADSLGKHVNPALQKNKHCQKVTS